MKIFKKILTICLAVSLVVGMASCSIFHSTDDCVDENKDHKCDVCEAPVGKCSDANVDHKCDYGCSKSFGVCEDVDYDHVCDYGCSKAFGQCADADLDHACDYGCNLGFGACEDADKNHNCDYGCSKTFGEHADADFDHACDYGCAEQVGEHIDANLDHVCDYGCTVTCGDHADANLDHACDYGCSDVIGEHTDADKDHACDYGCSEMIGVCADGNLDHKCDDGCAKAYGEHTDTNLDHACDYGCNEAIGECADSDLDHKCDYGCEKVYGEHADSGLDHVCDYGCKEAIGEHSDSDNDGDHSCDYCGAENLTQHIYGEAEKADADNHKYICNCGDVKTEAHRFDDGVDTIPATHTTEGVKTYTCQLCGESKTESIPALVGHTYNQKNTALEGALVSVATCTEPAIYKMSCICGEISETETFAYGVAAGHIPTEPVVEKSVDATCSVPGSYDEVVYCSVCGTYEISRNTVPVPVTGHNDNDGDLDCDTCEVKFYVLTLTDAKVVVNTKNYSTVANAYVAGEQIFISADDFKTVDGKTYMFVGFDKNKTDNRVGENGVSSYGFAMPAENISITAKYAEANTTFLTTATWNSGSKYNPAGMTATAITSSTDTDLQGLSGWSFIIPDNAAKTDSKTNNLTAASITAWGIDNEKTIKLVLKNHGEYDVTVEIWGEYFGYVCTTGNVTVPANSVVEAFIAFGPFSGASSTCDFMIQIRENMGGDGSGTVQLDVVAAIAKTYESKISDFITTSDKDIFMDFGESNESNTQANIAQASASGMNMKYWDKYGVMYFYGNNNTSADTYARERGNAIGGEAIHLQNGEKFTIYVKVTNLYGGAGKYSLVFTRGSSALNGAYLATKTFEFSEYGETKVFAIEIDPSVAGSSDNLQFGLKKAAADGTGGKINVLVQIAGENIFGELSE